MAKRIPHEAEYKRYFNGAIEGGFLKNVPNMADPTNPRLVIVSACGHASHNANRYGHFWERISPLTQLYCMNGGGVVYDPVYAAISSRTNGYTETAFNQLEDFVGLAVDDGTIEAESEIPFYPVFDIPCKVITSLNWRPSEFVASSIRVKTLLKNFHPRGVTFKVGLLYFLGEPIHSPGLTWYAPRCDMQQYTSEYSDRMSAEPEGVPPHR